MTAGIFTWLYISVTEHNLYKLNPDTCEVRRFYIHVIIDFTGCPQKMPSSQVVRIGYILRDFFGTPCR